MSKRAKAALASGLGLIALTATYLTAPWKGMENHAYYDKHWRSACNALTLFNRAAGKVVDGLRKWREMGGAQRIGELELCLAGLK